MKSEEGLARRPEGESQFATAMFNAQCSMFNVQCSMLNGYPFLEQPCSFGNNNIVFCEAFLHDVADAII